MDLTLVYSSDLATNSPISHSLCAAMPLPTTALALFQIILNFNIASDYMSHRLERRPSTEPAEARQRGLARALLLAAGERSGGAPKSFATVVLTSLRCYVTSYSHSTFARFLDPTQVGAGSAEPGWNLFCIFDHGKALLKKDDPRQGLFRSEGTVLASYSTSTLASPTVAFVRKRDGKGNFNFKRSDQSQLTNL